jgi:UDP-N-acetylmuramoyl-L-alanyl-D-glutamate--2,6-diaminopimelate ligase
MSTAAGATPSGPVFSAGGRLADLLAALPRREILHPAAPDLLISDLTADSRQVRPGSLFVAYQGVEVDGHRYIAEACQRGAVAIVAERPVETPHPLPYVLVPDGRAALAYLASAFYGHPSHRLVVIGVTGTDGKTTTCLMLQAILTAAGHPTGAITTVGALLGDEWQETGPHTTTPDALTVQRLLATMVRRGLGYAVLETTSHALDQGRTLGCAYDVAVLTNITPEHLDYHQTFEAYVAAKARLFQSLATAPRKPGVAKTSVLNADDPVSARFHIYPADRHLTYGLSQPADITAGAIATEGHRQHFRVQTPAGAFPVTLAVPGLFNCANALAAIGAALALGLPIPAIQQGLAAYRGAPGRLEFIDCGQPFAVVVDFAHTPNALRQVLTWLRGLTRGRLIVVFGCAGERDPQKRPQMGAIAGALADRIILTAEDPRRERVEDIIAQIATGCARAGRQAGVDYLAIPDRRTAIATALDLARPGDLILIAGKGHERTMCFGTTEVPWSDQAVVRELLGRRERR